MMKRAQFVLALGLILVPGVSQAVEYDGSQLAPAEKHLWNELEQSTWITQGSGRQIVYAIIDPNCPFSRALFERTQSLIDPQRTQVRWIPVAVPPQPVQDSLRKATSVLAGGFTQLAQAMQGGNPTARPSVREINEVTANVTMKADMDTVFRRAGVAVIGVPQFFYITNKGEMRFDNGDPTMAELTNVFRGSPSPP